MIAALMQSEPIHWPTRGIASGVVRIGLVAYWDAGLSNSHPGTGTTWTNIASSPADGSAASAYNLTTSGLTFTGTAGRRSAGEYLKGSGAGYGSIAASTTFTNSMHKAGAAFSFLWLGSLVLDGSNQILMTTTQNQTSWGVGVTFLMAGYKPRIFVDKGSGPSVIDVTARDTIASGVHAIGISVDAVGAGYFYVDGAYFPNAAGSDTWAATYTTPASTTSTHSLLLGGNTFGPKSSGTKDKVQILWNRALSKAEMDKNFNALRWRIGT